MLSKQEVINELNKLKTGQPTKDYGKRDEVVEIAKYAVDKLYDSTEPVFKKRGSIVGEEVDWPVYNTNFNPSFTPSEV